MTAEVCVLNKLAVAMAADSAVTLGASGDKIYTSVDKVFNLSKDAPVGFMVYGGASFLGMHWEVIVKQFRSEQCGQKYDHLEQYAEQFLEYIVNFDLFPEETREKYINGLLQWHFLKIRARVERCLDREAEEQDGLDEDDYPPVIVEELKKILTEIMDHSVIDGFTKTFVTKIRKEYKTNIDESKNEIFGNLEIQPAGEKLLRKIAIELLGREVFDPLESGIVFAGFGEKDYMPRLYSYRVECIVGGKLRLKQEHKNEITHENSASVVPFAQQEMVHTFMQGADPKLVNYMEQTTKKTLKGALGEIGGLIEEHEPDLAKRINPIIEKASESMLTKMFSSWQERQQDYWLPVLGIVDALPKDELASMAEALVNLTKFRRRVSTDREAVGGPIDVVVITKGDGFIWVKRKHYFKPELNPRAMANYGLEKA